MTSGLVDKLVDETGEKPRRLSGDAKAWLSGAIDSQYSVRGPHPSVAAELEPFRPTAPVTVHRGLLFSSEVAFHKFLKDAKANGEVLQYGGGGKFDFSISSWSHSKDTAYRFATCRPSGSMYHATLSWLQSKGNIQGEYGVVLQGVVQPEDVIVDMTLYSQGVGTKTYAVTDEVFVKHDAVIPCKIVWAGSKDGVVGDVSALTSRILGTDIVTVQAEQAIRDFKPGTYSLLGPGGAESTKLNHQSTRRDYVNYFQSVCQLKGVPLGPSDFKSIRSAVAKNPQLVNVSDSDVESYVLRRFKECNKTRTPLERCLYLHTPYDATDEVKQEHAAVKAKIAELLPRDWVEKALEKIKVELLQSYGPESKNMAWFKRSVLQQKDVNPWTH